MNSTKTKNAPAATPAAPTRRQALTGLIGLAAAATAGLAAAAPKSTHAAAAPAKSPTFDAELERLNGLGYRKRSPAEQKMEDGWNAVLIPAFRELLDALDEVRDRHGDECEDAECEWCADLEGFEYNVQLMADLAEGDASFAVMQAAEQESERRKAREAAAGTHCGCPVLRATHALDRLAGALDKTVDAHAAADAEDARLAEDAKVWGWTLAQVRAGFDNQSGVRMTAAGCKAYVAERMAMHRANGDLDGLDAGGMAEAAGG